MFLRKFIHFILPGFFVLQSPFVKAQFDEPVKRHFRYQLMGFGIVSSYTGDDRLTANIHSKIGAGVSVRGEFPIQRDLSFVPGFELVTQGFSVDSYYFAPGYSVLYDKNYEFEHDIRITELTMPLLFRISFIHGKEEDSKNHISLLVGYELKYNLLSHASVTDQKDGSTLYDSDIKMPYEHQFTGDLVGHNLMGGLALNHNLLPGKRTFFVELDYRYGLSRYVYNGNNGSNFLLFHNSGFSFGLGIRY